MLKVRKIPDGHERIGYVYDISLDGTVVNALGMNVISNTDGFNFQLPEKFRYTDENPYIGKGLGRNVTKGKTYTGPEADVAEFEDTYLNQAFNGGVLKNGLGIDEYCDALSVWACKTLSDRLGSPKWRQGASRNSCKFRAA